MQLALRFLSSLQTIFCELVTRLSENLYSVHTLPSSPLCGDFIFVALPLCQCAFPLDYSCTASNNSNSFTRASWKSLSRSRYFVQREPALRVRLQTRHRCTLQHPVWCLSLDDSLLICLDKTPMDLPLCACLIYLMSAHTHLYVVLSKQSWPLHVLVLGIKCPSHHVISGRNGSKSASHQRQHDGSPPPLPSARMSEEIGAWMGTTSVLPI